MLTYKKLQPKGKTELQKLESKLWEVFSLYIRLKYADNDGYSECFTCGHRLHFTKLQAGHAIGGRGNSILFEEDGCKPQCPTCNIYLHGNYHIFRENLGEATYQRLLIESKKELKFTPDLLKNNIEYYTQKVNEHKTRIGIL